MLQPALHIQATDTTPEDILQCRLLIEIGPGSFSYLLLNMDSMHPAVVKYFQIDHTEERPLAEVLREITHGDDILSGTVKETLLVYNFPESSLVPESLFDINMNRELTELVYGDLNKGLVLSEKVPGHELYNIYRIPAEVHNLFQQKFTAGKYWHHYSLQLCSELPLTTGGAPAAIKIIFYADKIIVLIFKNGRVQLVQANAYHDSKDVAYFLLNCCHQFAINQEEVELQVSGLIDAESAMYAELEKYFLHIVFEQLPEGIVAANGLDQYPLHFFSSLLKMAICV